MSRAIWSILELISGMGLRWDYSSFIVSKLENNLDVVKFLTSFDVIRLLDLKL